MCGRYTLTNPAQLSLRFDVPVTDDVALAPRYNIAPSQAIPIIIERPEGRVLQQARWGFKPPWSKDAAGRPAPINARAETLLDRPLFRDAVARRRCLIPADGFFEWQALPGRGGKQPMYVKLRDGGLFAIAGLYTEMREDTSGTCAIITCGPNDLMAPIHDRMPAVLDPQDEQTWLDPRVTAPGDVLGMLRPYPAERMQAYAVDTLVNNVRYDMPEVVAPFR